MQISDERAKRLAKMFFRCRRLFGLLEYEYCVSDVQKCQDGTYKTYIHPSRQVSKMQIDIAKEIALLPDGTPILKEETE